MHFGVLLGRAAVGERPKPLGAELRAQDKTTVVLLAQSKCFTGDRVLRSQCQALCHILKIDCKIGKKWASVMPFGHYFTERIHPYAYLADVLAQWPQDRAKPSDYLPDQWLLRHPEARLELNRST